MQHIAKQMLKLFRTRPKLNWQYLESEEDLQNALSSDGKVALFKHSTRCSVSSMAKNRLETSWDKDLKYMPIYFLDLIRYRSVSNKIADDLGVNHASPQLIVIENYTVVYDASHHMIQTSEIAKHI